jgi:hypothetical protein
MSHELEGIGDRPEESQNDEDRHYLDLMGFLQQSVRMDMKTSSLNHSF